MFLCGFTGARSLPEGTYHAPAGEASWLQFSAATKQSCRQGCLHATRAAECHTITSLIARPRWTNTDTAASGTLLSIEIRGGRAATKRRWSLLSASRTGENAKCECSPAENAVWVDRCNQKMRGGGRIAVHNRSPFYEFHQVRVQL